MTWINDIRGEAISNKTNYINTYGTRTWMNDKNLQLPLSPDKNNIDILKDEPMLIASSPSSTSGTGTLKYLATCLLDTMILLV